MVDVCFGDWYALEQSYFISYLQCQYEKLWLLSVDRQFELNGITFVWDEHKALQNPQKHQHVTFEQAVIGMDKQWNVLVVVHIAFEEEFIRIISARYADRRERKLYEN